MSSRGGCPQAAIAIFIAVAVTPLPALAQPYAGKQIRMVIGGGVGGGYDVYARALSRHIVRHIPGNPTIINQNMPGAAGLAATNWAYSIAPKDGSAIVATYNTLLAEPLFGNPQTRYDVLKFDYVGSIGKQQNVCGTWHTSPIKTIEQAKTRDITVAATGATGNSASMPRILNAVLGTKFKLVIGYGTTEQRLAVERGEVDGICGLSWSTLKASNPDWTQNHRLNVLVQTGSKPQPDLPNAPVLVDLVSDPNDKRVIELLFFSAEMGRPFLMPPGTPPEMVAAIREAFNATLKDPAFLAEAEKSGLEVDPTTGEEMTQVISRAYSTPKALVQKAIEYNNGGTQ
jgi:tripartite-type tricarboxylate transporter receptor subunit TctC